jgi:hypothetical protein
MNLRFILLVVLLALLAGVALGVYAATTFSPEPSVSVVGALQLGDDAQADYIANVAEAYAMDGDLNLARDRLARLRDAQIVARVETLALNTANQHNPTSQNLARLAVALGSKIKGLVALYTTATPPPTHTATDETAPVFSNIRATPTPYSSATPTPKPTQPPQYVVVPNDNPYIILPTNTPTITPTRRPATRVPTATLTPTPTEVPPPPYPIFEPDLSQWWGTIHYEPANVQPGQGYWHLAHAIYCDAFDGSDPRRHDFGCDEMPGGSTGTNIYVMSGGNPIDVYAGGSNLGDDVSIVGDKKKPGDMCNCDYSFESSDYRISVRGAPSDALSGFCLCSKNFGWGSRAHVRYFLYFEYRIR